MSHTFSANIKFSSSAFFPQGYADQLRVHAQLPRFGTEMEVDVEFVSGDTKKVLVGHQVW